MKDEIINNRVKQAVIYCRVSTKEQVDEGNSLVSQERLCREYALKEGYEIAEIFIEKGESAKTTDRKELKRMMEFCTTKRDRVQAVIAYKVDRISRNIADYSMIKVRLKKFNVTIRSVTEFFEDTPAGRFMESIIANVGQFDNEVRTERSVGGMKEAVQEGRYVWKAPLGYDNVRIDNKATIAPNAMAPLVTETFELIADRCYSTEVVRLMMKEKGLVDAKGNAINRSYFFRIIRNPLYKGTLKQFGMISKGTYQPMVTESLFDDVQAALKGRKNKIKHYVKENPDFPLRRFILNPEGKQLTGYWAKGKYKKYPYYSFHQPNTTIRTELLESMFMDFLQEYALDTRHLNQLKDYLEFRLNKQVANDTVADTAVLKRVEEVNQEIAFLFTTHRKGNVSETMFVSRMGRLENELEELQELQRVKKVDDFEIASVLNFVAEALKTPQFLWKKTSLDIRRKLQEFYFPIGLTFDGEKLRTLKVCSVFKLKKHFDSLKFPIVNLHNTETNTMSTPNMPPFEEMPLESKEFAEQVVDDLRKLSDIVEGKIVMEDKYPSEENI
ncbi:recombinase family protein [Mucilaginibacter sp.]|uniref:recombinase family protein n=1 Tax=Mucilaginibacter sp. TaxID=1882438 RepID=UPI0025EA2DFC|nr:recombinase family protein [Mucilaginibacter sp.]